MKINKSLLKEKIDNIEKKRKKEIKKLETKYETILENLQNKCNHKYDDGSSASTKTQVAMDGFLLGHEYYCDICGFCLIPYGIRI